MLHKTYNCAVVVLNKQGQVFNWHVGAEKFYNKTPGDILHHHFTVIYEDGGPPGRS